MTRVAAAPGATPQVVAAIVAALRARTRDDVAVATRPSAWRRAARLDALRGRRS